MLQPQRAFDQFNLGDQDLIARPAEHVDAGIQRGTAEAGSDRAVGGAGRRQHASARAPNGHVLIVAPGRRAGRLPGRQQRRLPQAVGDLAADEHHLGLAFRVDAGHIR